uniref:periphilin-1-like n=1 Tax=Arvicanthis niloticus TaxID=61156 RepID=UPI0014870573|nr:periphilin-1-like [Arvicanthis niloticus]XP_034361251.1 periphilin-1-like [Arvicanthis niloticus]
MLHIPVILGHRPGSVNRRDEMWSNRSYDEVPQNASSDESALRKTRDDLSASRQHECGVEKDDSRRKCSSSSHYSKQQSPHKGASCFSRKSGIDRKTSPHSRSGSSERHSSKQSKLHSSHGSELRKSRHAHSSYKRRSEGSKKRPGQSLKTSRDTHPKSSSAVPSSEMLNKLKRFDEKGLPKAANRHTVEKPEMADESDLPKISEFEVGFPVLMDQSQEPESNKKDDTEFINEQVANRHKAIVSKTKEIEQAYCQDCETFGMVVKMLVDKDPSLERPIQFALRQNLHEISERCVKELRQFIEEYDAAAS